MLVLLGSHPRCTKEWAHQVDQHLVLHLEPAQAQMLQVDLHQAEVLMPQVEVLMPQVGLDQVLHQVQMEDSFTAQLWLDSQRAFNLCVTVWTMTQLHRIAWMTPTAHEDS